MTYPHQNVGKGNDLWRGPVVAHQLNHLRVRVPARELQQVSGRGAGEGVDGLGRVPDHAHIVTFTYPQVQQALLQCVDVLVLVDYEVAVLRTHDPGDVLALGQDADGQQQHVLEVDDPPLGLELFVGLQHASHCGGVQASGVTACTMCGGGIGLGCEHADLGPLNLGGKVTHGNSVKLQTKSRAGLSDHCCLVRQHLWGRAADCLGPEVMELSQGRCVKRPGLNSRNTELAQPGAHLAGRSCRKCDGKHSLGLVGATENPVGNAVRDGPRLAGPGAGKDTHGPARAGRHLTLLRVQRIENIVGGQGSAGLLEWQRHRFRSSQTLTSGPFRNS